MARAVETPPHPDPLPARGEGGKRRRANLGIISLQEACRRRRRWSSLAALIAVLLAFLAASSTPRAQTTTVTIFEGARLLTGDGGVIENSAFIVANDRIVGVGRRGILQPPPGAARVDLSGKTVMPALVD